MLKNTILDNILLPTLGRAGTFVAAWLIANGATDTTAEQITIGLIAACLFVIDLFSSWVHRRWLKGNIDGN